ncbi:MAG TPA: amidohydrolase family protein [Gemmatimonadaceae bacterium]|nr:amidohydrolase family protein [Gemmatimonadaceae bacterium]
MSDVAPLGGPTPLIDVHAHFFQPDGARADWATLNARRLEGGAAIGIRWHVASVLGTWGATSPTYFQSPDDTVRGNDFMLEMQADHQDVIRSYVAVNPNDGEFAVREIERCVARGAVGLKLAAARRCDDPLLDAVIERARTHRLPVLHHIWQHRRRHWPSQDISDGADLAVLAARFPTVSFILAHIGGGGDYAHTFAAVRDVPNIHLDLSGSGIDRGMLDDALAAVGVQRLLWGADLTLCTGLAKLWALEVLGLPDDDLQDIRWRNAARIFPRRAFPGLSDAVHA